MRFKYLFKFSVCLFLFLSVVNLANADPLDKIVEFYTSSVPNPAEVKIDVLKVMETQQTSFYVYYQNCHSQNGCSSVLRVIGYHDL